MLRVYYSNRTEELLDAFVENVRRQRSEPSSIFDPVDLVVPNTNIQTYLELAVAKRAGVCANFRFQLAHEWLRRRTGLRNLVVTALFDDAMLQHDELEPVRTYLKAGGSERREVDRRRVQLGAELARVFADYEDYRPELLDCWRAGLFVGEEGSRDVETWQRRVWLELPQTSDDAERDLHTPVHIFGVSYMPRAIIERLGRAEGDVLLYTVNPCQEIWEVLDAPASAAPVSPTRRRYERRGKDLGPRELFSVDDPFRLSNTGEMLPLRLWGRAGRENLRLTNALTGCELVPRIRGPEPATLLEQLQRDIALREPERTQSAEAFDFDRDESIVVLECTGIRRELEAIGAEIWRLMAANDAKASADPDAKLRFNDIAVILTPAVAEKYHALVGSVFREMHDIPHNIVDLPVRSESRLSEAVGWLLDLPLSKFSRTDVMRFVTHPTVMASFPGASREDWLAWCDALGIVGGVDRRDQEDTYVEKDVFNWDQGLKRLALGTFMTGQRSGDDRLFLEGGDAYLPEEVSFDEMSSAAAMGLFLRSLLNDAQGAARVHMTVPAWMDLVGAYVSTYVRPHSPEDERVLRKCLARVGALAELGLGGKKVPYSVAHELLTAELGTLSGSRGQYLVDGVVVSSFLPMRAIPFKVVFIAGLGGEHFPARDRRDYLDLRGAHARAGDVSLREQDQYLFLETLHCARERLYLSYVARDELTGDALQPSSVVLELVETLERGYVAKVTRRRQPLRRVDDPETVRASPSAAREARARALGESLRAHLSRRTLPDAGELDLDDDVRAQLKLIAPPPTTQLVDGTKGITLSTVRRFLECPLQGSARFALRLRDVSSEDGLDREDELFHAGALERAQLLRETFRLGGDLARYDELALRFELRGERPTGLFGDAERERHLEILETWRRSLAEIAGTNGAGATLIRREPLSYTVGGVRIELGPSPLLFLPSPRLSIRLCAQPRSRFHPRRESLYGFLDHVFHAAAGTLLGEPYAFVAINAPPGERDRLQYERFTFAPISREAARGYLTALVEDMRRGVHDYLLPCEVVFNGLKPLAPVKTSSRFGPIDHPEDYDPLPESRAREIVARRFGLYFDSLGESLGESR